MTAQEALAQEAIQEITGDYLGTLARMVVDGKKRQDPTLAVALSIDALALLVEEVRQARASDGLAVGRGADVPVRSARRAASCPFGLDLAGAAVTMVYRLVADDGLEAWYELGLYHAKADAEGDLAVIEAAYPGRPYWVEFRVEELTVTGRRTPHELAVALIALADLSDIEMTWTDPNASESWQSEHGQPRPVA